MTINKRKNFKPTYLYIKTHNITGLKYFGKTNNKNPYIYKGSGIVWNRHCKKYNYDIRTDILGYFTNEIQCKQTAIYFSLINNIVKSKAWANLIIEQLDGGATKKNIVTVRDSSGNIFDVSKNDPRYINGEVVVIATGFVTVKDKNGKTFRVSKTDPRYINGELVSHLTGYIKSTSTIEKFKKTIKEYFKTHSGSFLNKTHTLETKEKMSKAKIGKNIKELSSQFGTMWITNGMISKKIKKDDIIPEGFKAGRIIKNRKLIVSNN
jgi:hypothetical protein